MPVGENIEVKVGERYTHGGARSARRLAWEVEHDGAGHDREGVGPIDYLALELPAARMKGEGLAALVDLVDRGIIRVLDLRVVKREADGTFTAMAITDLDHDGTLDLAIFEGIESGMLDDDDLRQAAELIEPGKVVALLLYENTWAAPFVAAMRRLVRSSSPAAAFRQTR